jgi:predicted acylesterase/phospholipase RssA
VLDVNDGSVRRAKQGPGWTPAAASEVWSLIAERARLGSLPGQRDDQARVALATEGGGMAAAVSAGMCAGLESLGLINSFDVVYGVSAARLV